MRFRIRPSWTQCKLCKETAASFNEEPPCHKCNTEEYEMLRIDGNYVYYIDGDVLNKIHMDYVVVVQ